MRTRGLLGAALAATLLLAGCAAPGTDAGAGAATRTDQHQEHHQHGADEDASMAGMDMGQKGGPSDPAAMICSAEIRDAVQRTFDLSRQPTGTPHWSKTDRTFHCGWQLPNGTLKMSVHDALDKTAGRAFYDDLSEQLSGKPIRGLENFGFPAFRTAEGDVAFLKDGKTLQVDATDLPTGALPADYTRGEAAYSVASAVIACWTE